MRTRKFPLPQAGSKKRESIRSVSPFTRSSMASTIHGGVNTSPWSATRCLDLTRLISKCSRSIACRCAGGTYECDEHRVDFRAGCFLRGHLKLAENTHLPRIYKRV